MFYCILLEYIQLLGYHVIHLGAMERAVIHSYYNKFFGTKLVGVSKL